MVQAIAAGTLTPIVCLSTKKGVGVSELMDVLASAALPPTAVTRTGSKGGDNVTLKPDPGAPLAAQVFKTRIDPFVQRLSFIRIYSGTLKKDTTVESPGARKGIKIGPLLSVQANETTPLDDAGPGEIVAVAKCEELHTGTSLGEVEPSPDCISYPYGWPGGGAQESWRRGEALRSAAQDYRRRFHHSPGSRSGDQRNGADRDERTSPDAHPGTTQAPRQGGGGDQGTKNSLSRNGSGRRRR